MICMGHLSSSSHFGSLYFRLLPLLNLTLPFWLFLTDHSECIEMSFVLMSYLQPLQHQHNLWPGSGVQEALRQRRGEAAQEAAQPGPLVEGAEQANQVREAIKILVNGLFRMAIPTRFFTHLIRPWTLCPATTKKRRLSPPRREIQFDLQDKHFCTSQVSRERA